MEQPINKPRPWNLPFWLIVGVMIVSALQNLLLYRTISGAGNDIPGKIIFFLLMWPFILLIEAIIYRLIRKRITDRKWVWAHLLFSLFAFVLLMVLRIVLSYIVLSNSAGKDNGYEYIRLINKIETYIFWASIVFGHIFFIVAISRSFSGKNSVQPDDNDEFLSELSG